MNRKSIQKFQIPAGPLRPQPYNQYDMPWVKDYKQRQALDDDEYQQYINQPYFKIHPKPTKEQWRALKYNAGRNAQLSQDNRNNKQRKQDQKRAVETRKQRELKAAEQQTATAIGEVLNRTMPSTIARAAYDATTGNKSFIGSMIEGNEGLGHPVANLAFDFVAPVGAAKGFKYAWEAIPKFARFGVSNHTGNWTQFGNNMYRLKPGYTGMNGVGIERKPISYGYNRESVANVAKEEFMDKTRRPLINRAANEDNTLADALDKVMSGTSETRFGTGNRTMTEPGPHEVLTGTYQDIKTGQPVVRGSGLIGTEPIPVTATEGAYRSSGSFGNMSSVTDSMLGGGKYGFRNWAELEDYVLSLDLDKQEFNYIADLINRTKSFENGLELGPKTTQGLISKKLRSNEGQYQQYLADQAELSDWLMGNLNFGAKNQRVVFPAPKAQQIIVGQSEDPGFAVRTANIGMELKDFTGKRFMYHQERGIPKEFWPNGMQPETYFSKYNTSPTLQRIILSSKYNPKVIFPLHFRGIGPNPFPGMTTMQVKGIHSTFKKGGKIKISAK